jgi:hypothetical protein
MTKPLVWIHTDALNSRLIEAAGQGTPALFVFDPEQIAGWSLNRIQFVYECLLELPVEIRRGPALTEIQRFAIENGCSQLLVSASPDPWIRHTVERLRASLPVQLQQPEPFVDLPPGIDLKRFSRYWQKAEKKLIG